jgi:hypothetical protein
MNRDRLIAFFLSVILLGTTLSSACKGVSSENPVKSALAPAKVIEAFYQACKGRSYDLASSFLSPASLDYFNNQEKNDPNKGFRAFVDYLSSNLNAPDFNSLRTEREQITDKSAVVDVAFDYRDNEPELIPHQLVRDDNWRIDMVSTMEPLNTSTPREGYRRDLESSGRWLRHPKYGEVWRPNDVGYNWRPYRDDGRFVRTEEGWTWISDRDWGDRVFHYGRWTQSGPMGWVWVPDDEYAPSWVTWRSNDQYVGWAPLSPGRSYSDDRYIPPSTSWVFVPAREFVETINVTETTRRVNYTQYQVPLSNYGPVYRSYTRYSGPRNYNGRFINEGLDLLFLERISGIRVRPYTRREVIVERGPRFIPPGHGGVPPGLYVRERAWAKKDFKHAEKDQRKFEKEQRKFDKKLDKEFKHADKHGGFGKGVGHGQGNGKGHGQGQGIEHGQGHGQGQGKGHGQGQGKGHGKGH